MDKISLKNFRCFREVNDVPLAPLTLLVGENSTGKTSFMAMLRALWNMAYRRQDPDFKEEPYDLGSFDEIAHHRGGRGGKADSFEIGCEMTDDIEQSVLRLAISFEERGAAPYITKKRLSNKNDTIWIEYTCNEEQNWRLCLGTKKDVWEIRPHSNLSLFPIDEIRMLPMEDVLDYWRVVGKARRNFLKLIPISGSKNPSPQDWNLLEEIGEAESRFFHLSEQPYASAPVRSKPHRTYDPSRLMRDPEGHYIPMYLASVHYRNKAQWKKLKSTLEMFGKESGLFDEISIKSLGKRESEPFQVQIKKFGNRAKGPLRNLIDVGYGVSQALPVITELLSDYVPPMMLLQQPEVHLHPSAQAALGSLFCQIAGPERRLVIETHSDHLLDRVRMDVRDGVGNLGPEDVSILFFEKRDLDTKIHPIKLDKKGNVLDAPSSYGRFFMEETNRSIFGKKRITR